MDAVKSFNAELSSLYEVKPPISKAKMTALTRGAIKAIKFYKHVVQSVEKFILKCKPEYKVPGLYVIDSIVRQSRHQFGAEKDVFAPRFAKNMQQTFANLFRCPPEDKSKVIRVLNLWQKNQVFAPDVIQPLFDLADPNHPIHREALAAAQQANASNGVQNAASLLNSLNKNSPAGKTPTKSQDAGHHQGTPNTSGLGGVDVNMLQQLQKLQRLLQQASSTPQDGSQQLSSSGQPVRFDKKLLDFDYGSDDDDDNKNPSPVVNASASQQVNSTLNSGIESLKNILSNPEVLRQLQTLQQLQSGGNQTVVTAPLTAHSLAQQHLNTQMDLEEKIRKLREMKQQEDEFDRHLAQTVPSLPFASECDLKPSYKHDPAYTIPNFDMTQPPPGYNQSGSNATMAVNMNYSQMSQGSPLLDEINNESEIEFVDENATNNGAEVIHLDQTDSQSPQSGRELDDRYDRRKRGGRSRSRDRRRSRSRDRRKRSHSRSRSRSRRRGRRSRSREREKERDKEKERERDRERRKRGLPPIKSENLSVCSTTLWVGHLSKLVHADELSDTFGEFGDIVSIDLIPPRGCAFIVMNRRQDASRCLAKLKNHKMQGKAITLAWAPGKGVKGKEWKDYWEVELGVSYIPWCKLKPTTDFESLEEGGMIDEDTMPNWMKQKIEEQRNMQTSKVMQPPMVVVASGDGSVIPIPGTDMTNAAPPGFLHMDGSQPPPTSTNATTNASTLPSGVDTSQPPPPQALAMPPMTIPLVPPFPMMRGTGMPLQIPPTMMAPNVPIGVPPPNLHQQGLQMMGYGQPVLPPPHMGQLAMSANDKGNLPPGGPPPGGPDVNNSMQRNTLLSSNTGYSQRIPPPLVPGQPGQSNNQNTSYSTTGGHHDDMDIDMDDADHGRDKNSQMPLSDQLLAAIGGNQSKGGSYHRDSEDRRSSRDSDRHHPRDHDRNQMRDRDSRNRRDSRDRNRDRNDRGRGDRDRRDTRDRRWSERGDRGDSKNDRDDKRRSEKTLSERLQEMANESTYAPRRDERERSNSGGAPPSLLDLPPLRPDMTAESGGGSKPWRSPKGHDHEENRDPRNHNDYDNRRGPNDYGLPRGGPPGFLPSGDMDDGRFDFRRDGFGRGGNQPPPDGPGGPPGGFDRRNNDGGFDNRMRGPPTGEFFGGGPGGPPNFRGGPMPPMMRPDGGPPQMPPFGPRGMMMGGPRGPPPPHMFNRGPRGPRPGIWLDGPRGGPPFFGGPPDSPMQFFPPGGGGGGGPPGGPGGMRPPFDDIRSRGGGPGGRNAPPAGHDERRRYRHDDSGDRDDSDYRNNRDSKRSRWNKNNSDDVTSAPRGGGSGVRSDDENSRSFDVSAEEEGGGGGGVGCDEKKIRHIDDDVVEQVDLCEESAGGDSLSQDFMVQDDTGIMAGDGGGDESRDDVVLQEDVGGDAGATTPLRDEPFENIEQSQEVEEVEEYHQESMEVHQEEQPPLPSPTPECEPEVAETEPDVVPTTEEG